MDTASLSRGQSGRGFGVNRQPPCSAEVKERAQLYLLLLLCVFMVGYNVSFFLAFYVPSCRL